LLLNSTSTEVPGSFGNASNSMIVGRLSPIIYCAVVSNIRGVLTAVLVVTLQVQCAMACVSHKPLPSSRSVNAAISGDCGQDGCNSKQRSGDGCTKSSYHAAASRQIRRVIPVTHHDAHPLESNLFQPLFRIVVVDEAEGFRLLPNTDTRVLPLRI
jgi:hypothetical protein